MSIVRYTNKKTGVVTLYESTSSGKRGRKKSEQETTLSAKEKQEQRYKLKYDKLLKECADKDERIKQLEHENKRLNFCLINLKDTITEMINSK